MRGSTALLDAIGDVINHVRKVHKYIRKYAGAEHLPEKTLFVITTDGMENSSVKYDYNQIKRLIEQQKECGWEFIFLGANIDAIEVAGHIGIDARRAVNYHADSKGTAQAFGAISNLACLLPGVKCLVFGYVHDFALHDQQIQVEQIFLYFGRAFFFRFNHCQIFCVFCSFS